MSTRKTTLFYIVLIAVASAPSEWSSRRSGVCPRLVGPDGRDAAGELGAAQRADRRDNVPEHRQERRAPVVVNIRTQARARGRELTEFEGGEELFRRFFGGRGPQQGAGRGARRHRATKTRR